MESSTDKDTIQAQFVLPRNELHDALSRLKAVTDKNAAQPILANVLFETADDSVSIRGTDFEIGGSITIQAEVVNRHGSFTVNADRITKLVKLAPKGSCVTFGVEEEEWLSVSWAARNFKIATMPAGEFPPMPEIEGPTFKVGPEFWEAVARVFHNVSTDETRYVLNGVNLQVENGSLKIAATDGHRMGRVQLKGKYPKLSKGQKAGVNLSRKFLHAAMRWFKGQEAQLTVVEGHSSIQAADATLLGRNIEGQYPNYDKLIGDVSKDYFTVNVKELVSAIKDVEGFASDRSKMIKWDIGKRRVTIVSEDTEIGSAEAVIVAETNAHAFTFGLNARYVLAELECIEGDEVAIFADSNDLLTPVAFTETDDLEGERYLGLIMPMRL